MIKYLQHEEINKNKWEYLVAQSQESNTARGGIFSRDVATPTKRGGILVVVLIVIISLLA